MTQHLQSSRSAKSSLITNAYKEADKNEKKKLLLAWAKAGGTKAQSPCVAVTNLDNN